MDEAKRNALAKELKVLRAKAGITQKELAEKSGVAECTIAFIESKNVSVTPRIDTLVKLAKALEVEEIALTKYLD